MFSFDSFSFILCARVGTMNSFLEKNSQIVSMFLEAIHTVVLLILLTVFFFIKHGITKHAFNVSTCFNEILTD